MKSIISSRPLTWAKSIWVPCALCLVAITGCAGIQTTTTLEPSPEASPTLPADDPTPLPTQPPEANLDSCTVWEDADPSTFDEIEQQVRKIRGREYRADAQDVWLTQGQLQDRIITQFLGDYSEDQALKEEALLSFLGLIETGADLRTLYAEILEEQAAGYYDHEDGEMVLLCDQISGLERVTYAHEYAHFLQDLTYDLETNFEIDPESCTADVDRCTAVHSLLEGEATLLQEQWLRTYGQPEDLTGLIEFFAEFEIPVFASAPPFIQDDITFSYLAGMEFVHHFYLKDGWAAVDKLLESPPVSTEQILHPARYPNDLPAEIVLPNFETDPETQWQRFDEGSLGEWRLLATLDAHLPPDVADEAAEGWGGDRYVILEGGPEEGPSFVLNTQWDTMRNAHEFYSALRTYGEARYGEPTEYTVSTALWDQSDQSVFIQLTSNQAAWIVSPSPKTTEDLSTILDLPIRP